ncbi:MAG: hypothetical protein R2847_10905 [Bacteroidia bacterium]
MYVISIVVAGQSKTTPDAVIEAKAIQQNSFWNNSNDFIYTATTLEVHVLFTKEI